MSYRPFAHDFSASSACEHAIRHYHLPRRGLSTFRFPVKESEGHAVALFDDFMYSVNGIDPCDLTAFELSTK